MQLRTLGACVLALLVVACGGETVTVDEQTVGTVQLPLTSPSSDGKVYRLVGATFNIQGPQTVTVTDTSADTVQTTLVAGAYTVELAGAWRLESTDAPGTTVAAQLLSPNPLPFSVTKGQTTQVRFQFKLPGNGSADVGIVVDSGGWIAGTFHFTEQVYEDPRNPFAELVGKSVPFLINMQSVTAVKDTWGQNLYVSSTSTTVQFGGPHSAALERAAASLKGAPIFFTLRAYPGGAIEFAGLNFESNGMERYKIELSPSGPIPGTLDSEGYPALRSFQYNASSASLTDGYAGVRGTASVNGSP